MNNKVLKNKASDYPAPSVKHFPQTKRKVTATVNHMSMGNKYPKATVSGLSSPAKKGPGIAKGNRVGVIIPKGAAK